MTKEQQIEESFIKKLVDIKYTYRQDITDRKSLEDNFRRRFNTLNRVNLTDSEFERLREEIITPDVFLASKKLREQNTFIREDGTPLQYMLVNIKDWCKNHYEVVNQLRINTENSNQRYDVIILINGIPVVQVELKNLQISPRRAIQQIVDYKKDVGNGYTNSLLCFMQLFIVSNRSDTYYFANNRNQHFSFNADEQFLPIYQLADKENKKISNLFDFSDSFLHKCTLGEMISRYMVMVESEQKILVMRPYQIYAVQAIVDCIEQNRGNGYIWHTTGSGKTLTSFKASTLLKDNPNIEKCLFVVDRKDLDRQTREEFNKFQEGSVEENTNTDTLVRRLLSQSYADKVIVTTIQKLGLALDPDSRKNYKERLEPLRDKRVVFIFDECHRSQFGDNHKAIKEFFPKAQLFGFTGTPIFTENATIPTREGETETYKTTDSVFEKSLHEYTITHAIEDKNVLKFHVDYFKIEAKDSLTDTQQKNIIASAILDKHNAVTDQQRFNAIFATGSINDAIAYYRLFRELQKQRKNEDENYIPLNIACVFSPPTQVIAKDENGNSKNVDDIKQLQGDLLQEREDNKIDPEGKKKALTEIIGDYNQQYSTAHTLYEFDLYYQDVQSRIKNQKYSNADYPHNNKIDIVIVVDMLLTGFDSKYLSTLYVDKNLKYHGLIQAFSRTNRVLNDTKPHGSILDFRKQTDSVNEAIVLFSGQHEDRPSEIWLVDPAPKVIEDYQKALTELADSMASYGLDCKPEEVNNLKGNAAKAEFIKKFKEVQRLKTQLDKYTDLTDEQEEKIEAILPNDDLRSFRAMYIETAQRLKAEQDKTSKDGEQKPDPIIEELDFELVLFASSVIDYDYIMGLIANMTQAKPSKRKLNKEQLIKLLISNANLMDERDEIIDYINSLEMDKPLNEAEIKDGYERFKTEQHQKELVSIAQKHNLTTESLNAFVSEIMDRMIFDGERLTDLMEPLELGWRDRRVKELELMDELVPYLNKLAQGREISGLSAYETK